MNNDKINDIEIIEPPMQELKKRGAWLPTACFGGCGFITIFILIIIIGIKLFIGHGPKKITELPKNFPQNIPIYDEYNIDKITYISGQYKSRSIRIATAFPQLILSPLTSSKNLDTVDKPTKKLSIVKKVLNFINTPSGDSRDTIQIEWYDIPSESDIMIHYYKTKLKDIGMIIENEEKNNNFTQFTFNNKENLSGTIRTEYTKNKTNIDYAFIIINLPHQNNKISTTTKIKK